MIRLSALKMRTKILVLLAPLVIGLLFVVFLNMKSLFEEKTESEEQGILITYVDLLSAYMHEVQAERALSIIYLNTKQDSDLQNFEEQTKKTTTAEQIARQKYENTPAHIIPDKMKKAAQAVIEFMEMRTSKEERIRRQDISVAENVRYFNDNISRVFGVMNTILDSANSAISFKDLSSRLNNLRLKELTGQERAVGLNGIAAGVFDNALFERFLTLQADEYTYIDSYLKRSGNDMINIYNTVILADSSNTKITALRKAILRGEPVTVKTQEWLEAFSQRINQLYLADQKIAETINEKMVAEQKNTKNELIQFSIISLVILLISTFLAYSTIKEIVSGIKEVVDISKTMAQGDFSNKLVIKSKDELGDLSSSFNDMIDKLTDLFNQLKLNGQSLASNSEELSAVSTQLLSASSQTKEQSNSVASATEQMSTNISTMASAVEEMSANTNNVSAASEQMSQNMNTIASTIEQMSQSITEIGKNSNNSMQIASQAMELSISATQTMNLLGDAAKEIGQVTSTIKGIAEKTDLLALNATIEAASAGDAGKGFAVVANEIKNLASRSAQAAENIADKISGIQKSSLDAVSVINNVSNIIKEINESIKVITRSVEEQATASNEVANNVSQANTGIQSIASSIGEIAKGASDISKNTGEAAKAAGEVSNNITGVNENATNATSGAQQVNTSSLELSKMAGELKTLIAKFKTRESA